MLTIREITEQIIEFQGYVKVQGITDYDEVIIYYEGEGTYGIPEEHLDREITYIYPYDNGEQAAICIELKVEEE